jgi:BirA family biotin operon repressor/biotin-[acetyl-CoA-carboxylase] ligase
VFCAALAVAETAAAQLPAGTSIEIKWPNDVLLAGRKTSGINLPAQVEAGRVEWAVLGVGLNVNTTLEEFPAELRDIATSLRIAAGARIDRVGCAEELLGRLEREIESLRAEGFARVLDRWHNFFRMQGDFVRVGGPGVARALEGEVCGVDPEGALLVQTEAGTERVLAGDVTLLARTNREET